MTQIVPGLEELKRKDGGEWWASMEHASSHNGFTVLFILSFFSILATVLIHFG